MLNKNVCPKCGQLYDLGLPACPVCNTPAQVLTDVEQPVQRKRLTEVERRERQQAQRREAAEARRREREERRAADAEEERLLEEEEERLQRERRRKKLEKRGLSEEEINQKLDKTAEKPTKGEADMKDYEPKKRDPARVPAAFSAAAILLLLIALALGGSFLSGAGTTVTTITIGSQVRQIDEGAMSAFGGTVVCDAGSAAAEWAAARGLSTSILQYTLSFVSEGETIPSRKAARGTALRLPTLSNAYRVFTGWYTKSPMSAKARMSAIFASISARVKPIMVPFM